MTLSHMAGGATMTPAQLLDQKQKANATMIEVEERRLEKMQRRQVNQSKFLAWSTVVPLGGLVGGIPP